MCTAQPNPSGADTLVPGNEATPGSRAIELARQRLLAVAPIIADGSDSPALRTSVSAPPKAAELPKIGRASDFLSPNRIGPQANLITGPQITSGSGPDAPDAAAMSAEPAARQTMDVAALQRNFTTNPLAIADADHQNQPAYTKVSQDWGTPRGIIDPLTHLPVRSAGGETLLWPSGINPIEVYNSGLNSNSAEALSAGPILFSQNGHWDSQRGGSRDGNINHPEFIDASTVVIGLYNAAAGVPLSATLTEQNNYARFRSHYKSTVPMDKVYTYLPARNVRNTVIGYQLAANIRKARAT